MKRKMESQQVSPLPHDHTAKHLTHTNTNTMDLDEADQAATSQQTVTTNETKEANVYNESDSNRSYYSVFLEQENLNEIKCGKLLRDLNIKSIVDIVKSGKKINYCESQRMERGK